MRAIKLWALIAVAMCVSLTRLKADEPAIEWVHNLDEAKQIAQAEKKDLVIYFTGEWCPYCRRLEAEVLKKPEFAVAAKDFVLVELDHPGDDEGLKRTAKEWFTRASNYYMVAGYPTVVVADSKGLPIAYTGYDYGVTPEKFLKQLATDRAGRQNRDAALAEAAKLGGVQRAKKLDEALKAVSPNLGSMVSRKVDPLFAFYGNVVDEIKSLDGDSGSTAKYYEKRAATRKEWDLKPEVAVFEELKRFKTFEDAPAAIAYIDQVLASIQDEDARWRLELKRQTQMELSANRKDVSEEERTLILVNALANARRMRNMPPKTEDIHERVLRHEAWMLERLHRTDEMVDVYDDLIKWAGDHQAKRKKFLRFKAAALMGQTDVDCTLAALRDFQAATEPKSEEWRDANAKIGSALVRSGRTKEAIEFRKQVIQIDPDGVVQFVALARNQQALGLLDDARQSLDCAEALLAKNPEPTNQERQERLKEAIAKLRELVGPTN